MHDEIERIFRAKDNTEIQTMGEHAGEEWLINHGFEKVEDGHYKWVGTVSDDILLTVHVWYVTCWDLDKGTNNTHCWEAKATTEYTYYDKSPECALAKVLKKYVKKEN